MTTTTLSMLDQAELLQLATNASAGNDSGAAIGYLKEAVSRGDASGIAHFLLGAEYAQIKMYDRAVSEMEAAIAVDPALSIARLQLGLLWLTSGVGDKAELVLAPLGELPDTDPLRAFGTGLCALIKDQFDEAVERLGTGIALNTSNTALNADMQMIIDKVTAMRDSGELAQTAATPEPDSAEETETAHHVLLSAYTGNTTH
jgi:tetratricopeptide (TPR) repeat protein